MLVMFAKCLEQDLINMLIDMIDTYDIQVS